MFSTLSGKQIKLLTNVIRVELVYAHKHAGRRGAQTPRHDRPQRRKLARVEVIHAARVELGEVRSAHTNFAWYLRETHPDVRVNDERQAEEAVDDATVDDEGAGGERDESRREQTLERPVVGAVNARWRREFDRVVHRADVDRYWGDQSSHSPLLE